MTTKKFYSNGKLLLSGEYVVLDGGLGWAIPTKYGQHLTVTENKSGLLSWQSVDDQGGIWFEGVYELNTLTEESSSVKEVSDSVVKLLKEAQRLNPLFLKEGKGYAIKTVLTFPKDWGLGSSSTLINNLASWAGINSYELLKATFGGSGYDIACANHDRPILYHLDNGTPKIEVLEFKTPFIDSLYFVYLNQKKNSREAIVAYRKLDVDSQLIANISQITRDLVTATEIANFEALLGEHERLLSAAMGITTIQKQLFEDYPHVIKSLGAWGGDFVLATGDQNTSRYFKEKGYDVVIPFSEMIL